MQIVTKGSEINIMGVLGTKHEAALTIRFKGELYSRNHTNFISPCDVKGKWPGCEAGSQNGDFHSRIFSTFKNDFQEV